MKNKLSVVKIGGSIIDDEQRLDNFMNNFANISDAKILVHGGGEIATKLSTKLGIETKMVNGRRITSKESLEVVTMVYAGLINKKLTAKLQSYGCNALGLSGTDANCITATIRDSKTVDYGWVGDVKEVNTSAIQLFLICRMTPVFCAISHDENGQLLNTNADTIAAEIAIAMSQEYEVELIYCFEKKGVLEDVNDDDSVIRAINSKTYNDLKAKGIIDAGMLPKMENCFYALGKRVSKVIIGDTQVIQNRKGLHTTLTL